MAHLGSLDGFRRIKHRMHNQLFIADSPDKAAGGSGPTVAQQVLALFASAQENVHIASPYFIPGEAGLELRAAPVRPRTTAASCSSPTRSAPPTSRWHARPMRSNAWRCLQAACASTRSAPTWVRACARSGDFGASHSALHAKVATVDGRWLFIGPMNLDPRSALINTEIGLLIDSPPLARTMTALSSRSLVYDAYRCVCRPTAGTSNGWSRAPTVHDGACRRTRRPLGQAVADPAAVLRRDEPAVVLGAWAARRSARRQQRTTSGAGAAEAIPEERPLARL